MMHYWDDDEPFWEFGTCEVEYTGRPLPESSTRVGNTHHPKCGWQDGALEMDCACKELFEEDYQETQAKEAEDLHEEYWQ